LIFVGVLKILETIIEEVSNRYPTFLTIAEAISLVVGIKETSSDSRKELSLSKKEQLKTIVNSEPEIKTKLFPKKEENKVEVKEEKNSNSEEDLDDDLDNFEREELDEDNVVNVDYSREEEHLVNELYGSTPVDYLNLFYGGTTSNVLGNPYTSEDNESSGMISDAENIFLTEAEAEKSMIKIQYAATMKNSEAVGYKERDKFANWVQFNPVLMRMFESVHGMTRNVEYDRLY